ncbi:polyprenyl synthetase family protein [Halobacillus campisalis]|uniref:Polyprenyl synthetase family protein n=1 Tax=Halobacillus campisalis TaxID=435909 RepID=A0ABW2K279_9BACI
MDSLIEYLDGKRQLVNTQLENYVTANTDEGRVRDAMLYSIEAGGKRLRPILLLATIEAFRGNPSKGLPVACALEMIHTYSLIHDDLPAMDNDDVRRGQPTNHKKFDEATAILAGDALLTLSFQIITDSNDLTNDEKVFIVRELSKASGPKGMVNGQMKDMQYENHDIPLRELEDIHRQKTGRLLNFAVLSGAYLAEADDQVMDNLTAMAGALGLIFQIQDDILDVVGDSHAIGKPIGSDEGNNKSTYPQLLGLEGAIAQKDGYVEVAQNALHESGINGTTLSELIDYLSSRDR